MLCCYLFGHNLPPICSVFSSHKSSARRNATALAGTNNSCQQVSQRLASDAQCCLRALHFGLSDPKHFLAALITLRLLLHDCPAAQQQVFHHHGHRALMWVLAATREPTAIEQVNKAIALFLSKENCTDSRSKWSLCLDYPGLGLSAVSHARP